MRRVLVHPFAGVLSAYGMGLADLRALREAQFDAPLAAVAEARARIDALAGDALAVLADQGVAAPALTLTAHLRYDGSHQSLPVPFGGVEAMREAFTAAHQARFGFASPERAILYEMLAAEAAGGGSSPAAPAPGPGAGRPETVLTLWAGGSWHDVPLYRREACGSATRIDGPAVIAEATGTVIVEPGWAARVDAAGNLVLSRETAVARPLAAGTGADPVLLEVFNNLFMSVADQMGATLANTAWSVNIKERLDFSCAVFDAAGDLVANAPHVPVHLGSMSHAVKTVISAVGATAREGDAWMLNSPWNGGTHLPDVTVVTPVFVGGRPAFWLGSRGHHADIGGRTPGSGPPDSTRIEEEGVVIDLFPLVAGGHLREAETRALLASGPWPCRSPDQNLADLKAQVAANETGRRELQRVVALHGAEVVSAYMAHVQANAEECVREVIDRLSDGAFAYPMDIGMTIHVAVRVDRKARSAVIDFTGTSPQHEGNYNAPQAVTRAVVLYVFRTLVGKPIPLNEGCLRPLTIIVPEGTLLNPRAPAAVIAGNTEVSQSACNALYGALGVVAAAQGTMNNFIWGNEAFQNYETICGGTGAGPGFDGCDAVQSHMTNTRMTDPEVLEKRFPVRLEELSIRKDSGGLGRWQGGNGAVRRLRFLAPVTVTTLCGSRSVPPFGVTGGAPGQTGENLVHWPDGCVERLVGNDERDLPAGAVFEMRTPGGGGWGDAASLHGDIAVAISDLQQQEDRVMNAKSLLDSLIGGLGQATGGQGAKGLADKAKGAWDSQSSLGKGAIAGGLLAVLMTRGGRQMLGTGAKVGGMAAIGALAFKAYEDWQAGQADRESGALPPPQGTGFLPEGAEADRLAGSLLAAMIAAAKADGHVTPDERARIDGQLANLGLEDEAAALIAAELDAPLDVDRIAALAGSEAEATQIYAVSLLAIDPDNAEETAYLAALARRLNLDAALVDSLHAEAAKLA
jgi:5-oxoprolinase (ATP-hydrolysing)